MLPPHSPRDKLPVSMADPRRDYLTRCALETLGASSPTGRWALPIAEMTTSLHNAPAMQEFLEQPSVRTLQVSVVPSANSSGANELDCSTSVGLSARSGTATSGVIFSHISRAVSGCGVLRLFKY